LYDNVPVFAQERLNKAALGSLSRDYFGGSNGEAFKECGWEAGLSAYIDWGSPAYVLDAATIPLLLNTTTLGIPAHFHVILDDWFTTISSSKEEDDVSDWWESLFANHFPYHFAGGFEIIKDLR
jgi:hypothetical protein